MPPLIRGAPDAKKSQQLILLQKNDAFLYRKRRVGEPEVARKINMIEAEFLVETSL
jgi:hypothetical protein